MSANTVLDIGGSCQVGVSINGTPLLSGAGVFPCSGAVIGLGIDMINAHGYTNLFAAGLSSSGQLRIQVQTSDADTSGTYTDPTSGLASLPGAFQSGGLLWLNSGGAGGGLLGAFVSGQALASGWGVAQAFQRPGRYVRANLLSGDFYAGDFVAGFIEQLHTTGSGGGYTLAPTSGSVSV